MSLVMTSFWTDGVTRKQVWDTGARTVTNYDTSGVQISQSAIAQGDYDRLLAVEVSQSRANNENALTSKATSAIAALTTDQSQFATLKSQAVTLRDSTTQFTTAQLNTQLRNLAAAIASICDNGVHLDQAAVALLRLTVGQLDDTSGT